MPTILQKDIFEKIKDDLDFTHGLQKFLMKIFDHYMNSNQLTETQRNKLARIRAQVDIQLKDL
jgi:hypothetical protein